MTINRALKDAVRCINIWRAGQVLFVFALSISDLLAQCPTVDFTLPATACLEQDMRITPGGTYDNYEWDFCSGDFENTPSASVFLPNGGSAFNIELVSENSLYYGFYFSRTFGTLFRLDYGTDPNSTPAIVDLGGLGVGGGGWLSIDIIKEGNEYIGFGIDYFNKVYRFGFGTSIANQPDAAEVIYEAGLLATPIDLKVVEDETGKFAFVANSANNTVTRFFFSTGYAMQKDLIATDFFTVTGSGSLSGLSFTRDCTGWYAVCTSIGGGQITMIQMANGLADPTPVCSPVTGLAFTPVSPAGVMLVYEDNKYYALITTLAGSSNLYRINFGPSIADATVVESANLGDLGMLTNIFGVSAHKVGSDWIIYASENAGPQVFRISFPGNCRVVPQYSTDAINDVEFTSSGAGKISLTVTDPGGAKTGVVKDITVAATAAPDLTIASANICAMHDVQLSVESVAGGITSYQWDFGDATPTSTDDNPVHVYAASGDYEIRLDVSAGACQNSAFTSIVMYDPPVADFQLPSGQLCTNSMFTFINTTTDVYNGNLTYAWTVDGVPAGTDRDLEFSFSEPGDADLTLLVAIPGCDDDETKTLTNVKEGPVADFSISGQCEDVAVLFTSDIPGAFAEAQWEFGDGQNATGEDAQHDYTAGNYNAALHVEGTDGCITTVVHPLNVYSAPATAFSIDLPPFSCAGAPSHFHDGTPPPVDSNLETWAWNFGDGGIGTGPDPQHTYVLAGNYQVELTVTTDKGCDVTIENSTTIHDSPDVTITHEIACEDKPTDFAAVTSSTVSVWQWKIDGVTYDQQNLSHTFQTSGDHVVQLTATASNQCQRILEESVNVPVVPVFDFSVINPCEGQATQFTSNVITPGEPVATYTWSFDGTTYEPGTSASHTFDQTGIYPVELLLTGSSGCAYSLIQNTSIHVTPLPSFTPTEKYGAAPLNIAFANTSVDGATYIWQFNDGSSTVTQASPAHIFTELGTYVVTMQATSEHGCQASTGGMVYVIVPHTDLSNEALSFVPVGSAGQVIAAVKVKNNSNYPIESFDVSIATGSGVVITETVHQTLPPMSEQTIMSGNALTFDPNGGYVCMTLHVTGDENAANDELCQSTDGESIVFEPYPNPAQGNLMVQYVGVATDEIEIRLVNQAGADAYSKLVPVGPGLNVFTLDVSNLAPGVYIVRVITSASVLSSRVIIGH